MGVMTIVTGSFGIVGNFIRKVEHYNQIFILTLFLAAKLEFEICSFSVVVFMSKDMRNCFHNLMIALNMSDR